jgi:hypothetical protein
MQLGRLAKPTVAIIDYQSVKTDCGCPEKGFDENKESTDIKIHLAVDANRIPLTHTVLPANTRP